MEQSTARTLTVPEGKKKDPFLMLGTAKSDLSCSSCSTIAVGLLSGQALTEGPQSLQLFCEGFCLGLGTKYGVVQGAVLCKMIRCLSFDCIP